MIPNLSSRFAGSIIMIFYQIDDAKILFSEANSPFLWHSGP